MKPKVNITRSAAALTVSISAFGLFAYNVAARTCDLSIEPIGARSNAAVKGATATAVNRETSKLVRSTVRQGFPYFADLPEGNYLVTVKKVRYKQTTDEVDHTCDESQDGAASTNILMWKGASTQKVDLVNAAPKRRNVFTIVGDMDPGVKVVQNPAKSDPSPRVPKIVSGGVLNGKAINLPMPKYPAPARKVEASGAVSVQVLVDEEGNVVSASAVSGHPLLRAAAESAARNATFSRTLISGQPVKVSGVLIYNFVP